MSLEALSWAIRQEVLQSSQKFVLVMLGNYASDRGMCYPSVETLCRATALTDDTVRRALNVLVDKGLIHDTGKKHGATQQIRIFRLPPDAWSEHAKGPQGSGVQSPEKAPKNLRESPEEGPNQPDPSNIGTGTRTGTVSVRAKARHIIPSPDECKAYGLEIGIDPDESSAFYDYFQSNGWKVSGKTAMKDWHAGMRHWKRQKIKFELRPDNEHSNRPYPNNRPTAADVRNSQITGAGLVRERIKAERAKPETTPWARNAKSGVSPEAPAAGRDAPRESY